MTLEQIFNIARSKRYLIVSTVNESGAPEAALMGFALTQANEVVFDTLSTSRKAVNLARNPRRPIFANGRTGAPARIGPTSPISSCNRSGYDTPTMPGLRWFRSSRSNRRIGGNSGLLAHCPDPRRRLYAGAHAYVDWCRRLSSRSLDDPRHVSRWR
jgi:hypothetical protein